MPNHPMVSVEEGVTAYVDPDSIASLISRCLDRLQLPEDFIRPRDTVVLKPNWIKEWDERHPEAGHWEQVITHPSVIEAMCLWVGRRLEAGGEVIVCDAPQTDSSFARIRSFCDLDGMIARCEAQFPHVKFQLLDLRAEEWTARDGVVVEKRALAGDPLGAVTVALNEGSEFVGFPGEGRLYGASYDAAETNRHHRGATHEYQLCRTPLEADVFINLPKLKTHKKVGLTCALKNLVGINANKNWLPHHTEGDPANGGDQFSSGTAKARAEHHLMRFIKALLKNNLFLSRLFVPLKGMGRAIFGDTGRVIRSGNWHGNDTCWRMVMDLNKCFFFFDGTGNPRRTPPRYLAVVDGIVAGEGNGPMAPDAKPCGVILAGTNPLAVDCTAAALMGFDWLRLRLLNRGFKQRPPALASFSYKDIQVSSNRAAWNGPLTALRESFRFRPHFGWVGHIESSPESSR